jgi:predicted membrane protein
MLAITEEKLEIMRYTRATMYKLLLLLVLIAPSITLANDGSLQGLIAGLTGFFNQVVIPFILGIAFLVFIVNVIRYFVFQGGNEEGQENAKNVALYSIGAFVFILSFWGIVNLLAGGVGLNDKPCYEDVTSDYVQNKFMGPSNCNHTTN